jgi:2'-hydroxyisoflavone reductase
MSTRRTFLKTAAAASGALLTGLPSALARAQALESAGRAPKPLRILVLGGTGFIGPHQVRYAVERGHTVSIFTRGRREADLPASVEHLEGDRNGQLGALVGRKWDVVIDSQATNPEWVRQSTALLRGKAQKYLFISTTHVYFPYPADIDETTRVRMSMEEEGADSYGVQKAQSEQLARDAFGSGAIILRPTYIVGPGDLTDRFTYWPVRLATGGEVLAPGKREDPVQFIDVRDLAEWMVRMVEDGKGGNYNVTGPRETLTMQSFLEQSKAALGSDARFTWVDDHDFLAAQRVQGVIPWVMPRGTYLGSADISNARAVKAGLTFRPLATTVRDTLAFQRSLPAEIQARSLTRFALTPQREAEILAAWKARAG